MTATVWLQIAAVISLLFTVGHSLGGLKRWSPMGDNPVLDSMRTVRFETRGARRTYLDFFLGFGWSISVMLLMQTVLLWQLASLVGTSPSLVRPLIGVIAAATAATGVIAWRFIFALPALFSALLFACLAVAFALAR